MTSLLRALCVVLAVALAACAGSPRATAPDSLPHAARPTVILIGIDGFRADYLDPARTPRLARLAAEGVRAERMRPSFPSITFPNHYALVTGLTPDRNGIVGNTMEDPNLPGRTFSLGNRAEANDPIWWDQAEPIWVTAKRQNVRVATLFWPGSESRIRGMRPDFWLPFEQSISSQARVNMLLGWFSTPSDERPAFATLYFDIVDTAGHRGGPNSDQLRAALTDVDTAIGKLIDGLTARGIAADLVVVADHGMAEVSPERVVLLDSLVPPGSTRLVSGGAYAGLHTVGPQAAEAEAALLAPHPHMQCWRKGEIPARFDYGKNPRVPPIVCLAQTGWTLTTREKFNPEYVRGGAHGYDNRDPTMAALFVANGPSFKAGATLPDIDNVDVYPLLARLIGVRPAPNVGDAGATAAALR